MGNAKYGSSDSRGSLIPISLRANTRIKYSWSSIKSLIWNFCVFAVTRPTSIHMVRLRSRIAMLYPSNGAPPSDSGIPHSITVVLLEVTRISKGPVGGDGTAVIKEL